MTGPLAQLVTLTTFGNDYLRNNKLDPNFRNNLSFKFCNTIDFRVFEKVIFSKQQKEKIIATSPNDWFKDLKRNDCKMLRLYFQGSVDQSMAKDYKLAGFVGGGGTWFIEAVQKKTSNAWVNRWEVTQKDDPDQNIWTVNYAQTLTDLPIANVQIPQDECQIKLEAALGAIEAFATAQKLDNWSNQFAAARKVLSSANPEEFYYYKSLIPTANYSLTARQILYAAGTAWVFGAMGSWNDLWFEETADNDQYELLTEELYERVNEAILSAVNSY
jgi:hypothetical protein